MLNNILVIIIIENCIQKCISTGVVLRNRKIMNMIGDIIITLLYVFLKRFCWQKNVVSSLIVFLIKKASLQDKMSRLQEASSSYALLIYQSDLYLSFCTLLKRNSIGLVCCFLVCRQKSDSLSALLFLLVLCTKKSWHVRNS